MMPSCPSAASLGRRMRGTVEIAERVRCSQPFIRKCKGGSSLTDSRGCMCGMLAAPSRPSRLGWKRAF